ncbi:MAG: two-component regulator propeller domain-containing protein [Bacteroidia bacterium]
MNLPGKILFLSILLIPCILYGQESPNLRFSHITVEMGLSNGSVNAFLRDRQGFMWVGTSDGLNRYDGNEVRIYEHDPADSSSLSANTVTSLLEVADGSIWVGTSGGGVSVYHPATETFSHYLHNPNDTSSLSNDYVNVIYSGRDETIWVGTNQGLNRFIPLPNGSFEVFSNQNPHQTALSNNTITSLWQDPSGVIWAGTENGLNQLHFQPGKKYPEVRGFNRNPDHQLRLKSLNIKYLYEDPEYRGQILWVATRNGLHRITLDSGKNYLPVGLTYYSGDPEQADSLSENFVTSLVRDESGTLWAGTRGGGLNQLIEGHGKIHFHRHINEPSNPTSLGGNRVIALFSDHHGLLWVGLETNGISQIVTRQAILSSENPGYGSFYHHLTSDDTRESIYANVITALYEDKNGNLWIGTEGSGCRRISPDGQVLHFYPDEKNPQSLSHSLVTTFTEDREGHIWIGTFGGLNRYLPEKQGFVRYFAGKDIAGGLNNQRIFATLFDEDGILWIGTRGGGLNRFDPKTEIFTHFLNDPRQPESISNNYVWALEPEGETLIWLATDEGLNLFDKEKGTFTHFTHQRNVVNSLSNNFINTLFRDHNGTIWVGTDGGGLNKMLREGGQVVFQNYTRKNGLPDNVIYGIEEDQSGNLWISTNQGLSRFSPETNGETYSSFKNYDINDGLQSNEFNNGAHFTSPLGKMYFGGMNGYNSFWPDHIQGNPYPPEVVLTRLKILNETVSAGQTLSNGSTPLRESISQTHDLNLTHRDYVVSIEFAALNYIFPGKNRYAYKLEGFDEDWIYTGQDQKATYTNLHPGDYIFKVKACNNDGIWNETGASLSIHVSPPPWKTWWAYSIYFIISGILLAGFIHYRDQVRISLETARAEEREQVRKNAAADFHDELGNKLTKINLFIELAKRQASQTQQPLLQKVENNVQALSDGMRDLIWVLDPDQDSLYDTIVHIKDFGDGLFEHTETRFRTTGISPELEKIRLTLPVRRHLVLIFKEAMNNALKYAGGGDVFFRVHYVEGSLSIEFQDQGKGLDKEGQRTGYGLKNMQERAGKIGATFQINSPPEGGTLIVVTMILPHSGDSQANKNKILLI